ncbi:hypothetical protein [Treponema denticola]|uniref:Uncharacterized protein n=1 Tax=Treponema denticola SP33 TaxID=999437 RepID=M2ALH2_TREDN|nr:hypothetical protein [Treponema denticola]EMB24171.1 hypothetical protein HMPREF9733_01620 [Treponema denticola SP33]EPF37627.1 hypothetical protein HMPREF9732_00218 [Treponema denticola SP32]
MKQKGLFDEEDRLRVLIKLGDSLEKLNGKIKIGNSNLGKIINEKRLDGVIESGARILLNSDPTKATANSAYAMEVQKLAENGYEFVKTVVKEVECWEGIK